MVSVHTSSPPKVHTAYTSGGVSVTVPVVSAIRRVRVWNLETKVGLSLVWKSTWKEKKRVQSTVVQESRASWAPGISQSSPRIHTACTNPVLFQVQPEETKKPPGTNFACVGTSSPRFLPASDSEWPHHLSQRRRWGRTSRFLSMRIRASYSYLGDIGGHRWHCTCFWKCSAFLGFKQLAMDPGRVHKL